MHKQVIIVIDSLKLPKGKLAAQCAHAAVAATRKADSATKKAWMAEGMPKIVVKVDTEKELDALLGQAKKAGLANAVITDAGKTVVAPGTTTCGAIGPGPADAVDAITSDLRLL